MSVPRRRPEVPNDPLRQHLKDVRLGLLRLHKALIDSERHAYEQQHGPLSNGQFLQALLQDPFFEWLRPFSGLIAEIDEALATREPIADDRTAAYIAQTAALVTTPPDGQAADRYTRVRELNPEVLVAHIDLHHRISAATKKPRG